MNAEPISAHTFAVRRTAARLGGKGFRVLRVKLHDKVPVDAGWPEKATDHPKAIDEWFPQHGDEFNIGVACGPQPNGKNLVCIDVDTKYDGLAKWAQLVEINGIPPTAMHITPTGGLHIFFNAPFPVSNANGLPQGIDVRGAGGQVVMPSSTRIIDGDVVAYAAVPGCGLWEHAVADLPEWLCALLRPVERTVERHPSVPKPSTDGRGLDNADWLRDHWDWVGELEAIGYRVVRHSGNDVYVAHPEATSPHSAVVHLDEGWMMAFSDNMPAPLRPDRQYSTDGFVRWSPYDWFTATQHGGSYSEATREINRRRAGVSVPASPSPGVERRAEPSALEGDDTPLYQPREFYGQRPWMRACLQMAEAVGGSPSAHLLAYLARWATLIPPGYSIPAINGAPSSFDLLGVIAGTSGSGKTSPMRNAAEMLPVHRDDLRLGLGIGSGEGIIEAFYGIVEGERDDGKKFKERRKCIAGVNFTVSEGLIFAELAGRGGTTHVTRLCDAWSGAALSTANASAETFRHIEVNQYRLTLVMGIQADMAHELMNDSSASQGFVGRLLFAWAEEPRIAPRPRPPETVVMTVPPAVVIEGVYQPVYLEYPQSVYDEIQAASDARVGTNVPVEDHHHDLLRCKVAGIVALMAERTSVSDDDWAIATALVNTSKTVRNHLYQHRLQKTRDIRHSQAEARAEVEIVVDDIKERQAIARVAEAIRRKVGPPWSRNKLCKAVTSTATRHRFDAALDLAAANGWITVVEGRVEKA